MRRKRNYAMEKLNVPKRVTLPNGRTFVAHYKHILRDDLPLNIVMRRTYRQRAAPRGRRRRQRQGGKGYLVSSKRLLKIPWFEHLPKKDSNTHLVSITI